MDESKCCSKQTERANFMDESSQGAHRGSFGWNLWSLAMVNTYMWRYGKHRRREPGTSLREVVHGWHLHAHDKDSQ